MQTIEQLSKDLDVSKITIYNKLKLLNDKLTNHISKENNITYIDKIGANIIKKSISPKKLKRDMTIKLKQEHEENQQEQQEEEIKESKLINLLQKQIEDLRQDKESQIADLKRDKEELIKQLSIKDEQIKESSRLQENTQILLRQSQERLYLLEQKEVSVHPEQEEKKSWFKKIFS